MAEVVKADEICKRAAKLVSGDREKSYGHKEENFDNIASIWNSYLGDRIDCDLPIDAHDAALMMALMKIARTKTGEGTIDNYIDACGYLGIAGEL
jgi:hypothetical protein